MKAEYKQPCNQAKKAARFDKTFFSTESSSII